MDYQQNDNSSSHRRDTSTRVVYVPGRWRGRRRFASLIPSGWRLTPIHKVMGDHASVRPTTDKVSLKLQPVNTKKASQNYLFRNAFYVEIPRLERGLSEPKSLVLPLHHTSIQPSKDRTIFRFCQKYLQSIGFLTCFAYFSSGLPQV